MVHTGAFFLAGTFFAHLSMNMFAGGGGGNPSLCFSFLGLARAVSAVEFVTPVMTRDLGGYFSDCFSPCSG